MSWEFGVIVLPSLRPITLLCAVDVDVIAGGV